MPVSTKNYTNFAIGYVCESVPAYSARVRHDPGDRQVHFHIHNVFEIMLVVQGCSHIECGDEKLFLKAPYIVCYPPGVPHAQSNYSSKMSERWCFPVFPADIGQSIELPNSVAAVQLTEDQCEIFTSYAQMLYRHWGGVRYNYPQDCDQYLLL